MTQPLGRSDNLMRKSIVGGSSAVSAPTLALSEAAVVRVIRGEGREDVSQGVLELQRDDRRPDGESAGEARGTHGRCHLGVEATTLEVSAATRSIARADKRTGYEEWLREVARLSAIDTPVRRESP